jgi:hypothetical protein
VKSIGINWQKGLVEFVIVVVGVMLALAADRWQQDWQDRKRAVEYLTRLEADLESDMVAYESIVSSSAEIDKAALYIVEVYRGRGVPSDERERFVMAVLAASFSPFPQGTNATYVDLVNTGSLALLPVELRSQITTYYENKDTLIARLQLFRDSHREGYWQKPSFILGPDVLPVLWTSRAGQSASMAPKPGSLTLESEYIEQAITKLRSVDNLEQLAAQVRYYMAQRTNIAGIRLANNARSLQEILSNAAEY